MKMERLRYHKYGLTEGATYKTNKYGDLIVVKLWNSLEVDVRFVDTDYETTVYSRNVRSGCVKDKLRPSVYGIGYIGVGGYRANENKKTTPAYGRWERMLERCYKINSKNYKKYGAKGVTVCPEWHNFQTFAEWFYRTKPEGDDWQMDKDGLSGDVKVYSPETVQWLTLVENARDSQVGRVKPMNIYNCETHELIAENVVAYSWGTENGYFPTMLAKSARADHTKPHHWEKNPWKYKGVYAVYI